MAYAGDPPLLADTLRSAANELGERIQDLTVRTWEDLNIGGRPLVSTITDSIDAAQVLVADVTQLNQNVVFEVGYAIGRQRRVWLTRDASDVTAMSEWDGFGLFRTIGQTRFSTSDELVGRFQNERPDLDGTNLVTDLLGAVPDGPLQTSILYYAETVQTDAGRDALRAVERYSRSDLPAMTVDPNETSVHTIAWYAQQVQSAASVIVHLAANRRRDSVLHNARASFVAGLALGMDRQVLLLAEDDLEPALDYADLLYHYRSAREAAERVTYFLGRSLQATITRLDQRASLTRQKQHRSKLSGIRIGEYIAENEAADLERYFVETATFQSVNNGESRLFVGAKGVGKSAVALHSEKAIRSDRRSLACLIKPAGYDFEGVVRLFQGYEETDTRGYVAEALWKYLLTTELCLAVEHDVSLRPVGAVPDTPEWELVRFISKNEAWVKQDFAARLENAVDRLSSVETKGKLGDQRQRIAEALHMGPLRQLWDLLGPALGARDRVTILVDNLDKAWGTAVPIEPLSRLLLGLLSTMDGFRNDLTRAARPASVQVSFCVFIRRDVFDVVSSLAREPDKLPARHMTWHGEAALTELPEARYAALYDREEAGVAFWSDCFCSAVEGVPIKDWILASCLPKPRDIVYLCNAALETAAARRHAKVEATDLRDAVAQYSEFAFDAITVEGAQRVARIDDVLLEFAGGPSELGIDELHATIAQTGVHGIEPPQIVSVLRELGFLGIRMAGGPITFVETPREQKKAEVLQRRAAKSSSRPVSYAIHPAFRPFLEIDSAVPMSLG